MDTIKKRKIVHDGALLDRSERIMRTVAYVVLTLLSLIALLPCMHVFSKAFSSGADVTGGTVLFFPRKLLSRSATVPISLMISVIIS